MTVNIALHPPPEIPIANGISIYGFAKDWVLHLLNRVEIWALGRPPNDSSPDALLLHPLNCLSTGVDGGIILLIFDIEVIILKISLDESKDLGAVFACVHIAPFLLLLAFGFALFDENWCAILINCEICRFLPKEMRTFLPAVDASLEHPAYLD